jgi:hypothetical protein
MRCPSAGRAAVLGCLLGFVAWWMTRKPAFLAGALLIVANWPWTIFGIQSTNNLLMQTDLSDAGPQSRALIKKWNSLHAVRTVLGALATLAFLFALAS